MWNVAAGNGVTDPTEGIRITMRVTKDSPPTIKELKVPDSIIDVTTYQSGMIFNNGADRKR